MGAAQESLPQQAEVTIGLLPACFPGKMTQWHRCPLWDVPQRLWNVPQRLVDVPQSLWDVPQYLWDVPQSLLDVPQSQGQHSGGC